MGCGDSKHADSDDNKDGSLTDQLVANGVTPSVANPIKTTDKTPLITDDEHSATHEVVANSKASSPAPAPASKAAAAPAPKAAAAPAPAPAPTPAAAPKAAPAAALTAEPASAPTPFGKLNNNITNVRKVAAWAETAAAGDSCSFEFPKSKKAKGFYKYTLTAKGSGAYSLLQDDTDTVVDGGDFDEVLLAMKAVTEKK